MLAVNKTLFMKLRLHYLKRLQSKCATTGLTVTVLHYKIIHIFCANKANQKLNYEQTGPYHKICVPELSRDDGHDLHKACYVDNIM